jgi:predicted RND superfamily exporter protein
VIGKRTLGILARLVTNHPGRVLAVCAAITIVCVYGATRFGIRTQLAEMMPKDIPQISEYLDIADDYSSDITIMITLESPEKDVKLMCRAAGELAAKLEKIQLVRPSKNAEVTVKQKYALFKGEFPQGVEYDTLNLVRRVDYKQDTVFLSKYGLLIKDSGEFDRVAAVLGSPRVEGILSGINHEIEKELAGNLAEASDDYYTKVYNETGRIHNFLESMESFITHGDSSGVIQSVSTFLGGSPYYLSSDNTTLLMMLQPAVSFDKFDELMYLGYRIDDTLNTFRDRYPQLTTGRTGTVMILVDSINGAAINFDWGTAFEFAIIFLLLIGSFREWKNPFLLFVALLTGVVWATGILGFLFGEINILSAAFCIVLVGLGIDYGIHFISGFSDARYFHKSTSESIKYMYGRVGSGVIIGALTTAAVFFCLSLTGFQVYFQMGIVIGISVLVMLAAQLVVLPALISWDSKGNSVIDGVLYKCKLGFMVRLWETSRRAFQKAFHLSFLMKLIRKEEFWFLSVMGKYLGRPSVAVAVIVITAALVCLSAVRAHSLEWEYDLMAMQPKGALSSITQNTILEKFGMFPNFVMVEARNLEECRFLSEEYRQWGRQMGLIGRVDAITDYLPPEDAQSRNSAALERFQENILKGAHTDSVSVSAANIANELFRMRQNLDDLARAAALTDDNSAVKDRLIVADSDMDKLIMRLTAKMRIADDQVSETLSALQKIIYGTVKSGLERMSDREVLTLENLPNEIRSRYENSNNDNLIINVYPREYVWDEKTLRDFNYQIEEVNNRTTGLLTIFQLLIDLIMLKGWDAIVMGTIATILILLIEIRSFSRTLLMVLSLAIGIVWMLGLMEVFGIKFSLMTFMALPLIVGIGLDHGIHVVDRYTIEGRGSMSFVLKCTGRAILLTSIVTMMGFGALGLGEHAGLADFGMTIFLGIGACFVSSAFVLPAIITIWERVNKH